MGSDSIPLAPGVPFPPSFHFLTVHLMGRLRPHEPESRMFGDSPSGENAWAGCFREADLLGVIRGPIALECQPRAGVAFE
jgi:hypothetical protein